MTIADSASLQVSFKDESAFATPPSGNYQIFRWISEDLGQDQDSTQSQEQRSDGEVPDTIAHSIRGAGTLGHEIIAQNGHNLMKAAMGSPALTAEVVLAAAVTTISFAPANNRMSKTTAWAATPVVGSYVKVAGSPNSSNVGIFRVNAFVNSGTFTIDLGGKVLTTESAGATITVTQIGYFTLGTTLTTFTFEKWFSNLTTSYELLKGMGVDTMTFAGSSNGIATGQFSFLGSQGVNATASPGSGYTAAPAGGVVNTVRGVTLIGGASYALQNLTGFNFELGNNLRAQNQQMGSPYAIGIGRGQRFCRGGLQAYFVDNTQFADFYADSFTNMTFILADQTGKGYAIEMPKMKIFGAKRPSPNPNADIIANLQWAAMKESAFTVRLHATVT